MVVRLAKDGKTEKATPKRREEAKKKGQVIKSKDLNILLMYMVFFIGIVFFQEEIAFVFYNMMVTGFELVAIGVPPKDLVYNIALIALPLLLITYSLVLLFMTVNQVIQVGFLFSLQAVKPDFKRINPANYFKNVGNLKKMAFEIFKNIIMFIIITSVIFSVYKNNIYNIQSVIILGWSESLTLFSEMLKEFAIKLGIIYLVLGVIDYAFQKYQHEENLKMKPQEIKDEQKDQQGDPMMKGRISQVRMQMLERQVKKEVKEAQFVVVNPTHYSVAVRFNKKKNDGVPKVLVKGVDEFALIIRRIAEENKIPIIEDKKVARGLYNKVEEQDYIPDEMFEVVGKIIYDLYEQGKLEL